MGFIIAFLYAASLDCSYDCCKKSNTRPNSESVLCSLFSQLYCAGPSLVVCKCGDHACSVFPFSLQSYKHEENITLYRLLFPKLNLGFLHSLNQLELAGKGASRAVPFCGCFRSSSLPTLFHCFPKPDILSCRLSCAVLLT